MAQRHTVDFTDFDLTPVAGRAVDFVKDATYITVGLGLLAYQRAQVKRREIERALRN